MRYVLLTRDSGFLRTALFFLGGVLFASIIVVLLNMLGFDAVAAIRDRSLSDAPEAGLLSDLGIFMVAFAGCLAILRGVLSSSLAIGVLGLFCCIFAADDAFMLHEQFGHMEVLFFAFYGALAVAILSLFRAQGVQRFAWPMMVVLAAFVASVAVDVLWGVFIEQFFPAADATGWITNVGFILEDVPKFGGIVVLASFAIGESILFSARLREQIS